MTETAPRSRREPGSAASVVINAAGLPVQVRDTMPHKENGRIVETATEARSGETRGHMRWVLFVSTIAVVAIFVYLWLHYFV